MPIRHPTLALLAASCTLHLGCNLGLGGVVGGSFANTGNDTVPRFFHNASPLPDGRVLVTGGLSIQLFPLTLISLNHVATYNPTAGAFSSTFSPTGGGPATSPTLATPRSSHTQTTLLDGRVLVTGGHVGASGTSPGFPTSSVEIFNPAAGLFAPGPAMSTPRAAHTATLVADGRVVVAGAASWQLFNPVGDTWSAPIPLARSREGHAAVLLADAGGPGADRVLLVGGAGSGGNTLEILDPAAQSTTLMASTLANFIDDAAAAPLPDGAVLIIGGQDLLTGNTLATTYRYDPAADSLALVPAPPNRPAGLADHEAVPLGRFVAVFGGEQEIAGSDTELDYAAIYDSTIDDWIWTGTMNHPHDDFPAVTLADGRILLIGGGVPLFGNEAPSNTAELFTPLLAMLGDVSGDEQITIADIDPFARVLVDPASATSRERCAADANTDQVVDAHDLQPFVDLLLGV